MTIPLVPLLAPFAVAFAVGLGATLVCERIARRTGLVIRPSADRWHRRPTPLLGGVAIVLGTLPGLAWTGPSTPRLGAAVVVALAMAGIGLYDDLRALRPPVKLVAQVVVAAVLVQLGFQLRLTRSPLLNLFLTLFWIVGITNALNLLDNMDGLAAGMAAIAAGFRVAFFLFDGDLVAAQVTTAFMGALVGFLVRNFPPARIFMGDAGSLFVGFLLSALCLAAGLPYSRGMSGVLLLPVLLMLIPIFDTTFVTVTRLLGGRRVSEGGRDHTSHRLLALGIGERGALALLYGISVVSGLLAVLSYRYGFTYTIVLQVLLVVGLILLGVHLSRVHVARPEPAPPAGARTNGALVRLVVDFQYKRQVATVAMDLVLIVLAYYTAYLLRFEDTLALELRVFAATVAPVLVCQILALTLSGAYRGLWRYTSLADLPRLIGAITIGSAASMVYFVFTRRFAGVSRAVFMIDWILLCGLVSTSRLSFRLLSELLRQPRQGLRRVLIYGAGDGGELTLRELRNNPELGRRAVGFVDDDPGKVGARIHAVPVLGDLDAVGGLLAKHRITEVVVASRRIPVERLRRLEALCAISGVTVVRSSVRLDTSRDA
jgi:UDP-GlcNAc:undecaprenyl-phosphate/decaprenyl-phosphate GlcNAc-1-phosphate transferase